MPYRSRRPALLRLSARFLVFGIWTALVGLFVLYFAVQMSTMLSSATAGFTGAAGSFGLGGTLASGVVALYRGGMFTLGVGGVLMAIGSAFVVAVVR